MQNNNRPSLLPPLMPFFSPAYPPPPPFYPGSFEQNMFALRPPPLLPQFQYTESAVRRERVDFNQLCQSRNSLFDTIKDHLKENDEALAVKSVQLNKNKPEVKNSKITISYYQNSMTRLNDILNELKEKYEEVKDSMLNKNVQGEVKRLTDEYTKLYEELNDEKNVNQFKKAIEKRKLKRKRVYKRRAEIRLNEMFREKEIQQKHKEIDENLKKIQDDIKKEKMKNEARKLADETLNQVRKKLADTQAMIDYCESLRRLRNIRRQHARDKSLYPRDYDAAEEDFTSSLNDIDTVLQLQKIIYENEKQNLILMLDSEKEKRTRAEKEYFEKQLRLFEFKIKTVLFGTHDNIDVCFDANDICRKMKEFYLQAEKSIDCLIQTRYEWDQYIVAQNNMQIGSSSVPIDWVLPDKPSDVNWKQHLIIDK